MIDTGSVVEQLAEGIWRFQTPQWQTNSLVVVRDGEALVIDPAWTREEMVRIHAMAASAGGPIYFLVTHADPDHVCGMDVFPDATIYVGTESAKLIEAGLSTIILRSNGSDWDYEFPFEVRFDVAVEAGAEFSCGPFRVATRDARGHMIDGVAFVLLDEGILAPGDNLCTSMSPMVAWSVSHARSTTESLIDALRTYEIRWVVPGHGSIMSGADALKVAAEDLEYLEALEAGCVEAREKGLSWAETYVKLLAIDQPRPNSADIEIYTPKAMNARRAMLDAGILRPGEAPHPIGMPPQFVGF